MIETPLTPEDAITKNNDAVEQLVVANALVIELQGKLEREQCISAALRDDVKNFLRKEELLKANQKKLADAAEMLWSVMANVAEGDWTKQSQVWQDAAAVWRDNYFKILNEIK